jgi:hypothetical protein
LQEQGQVLLQVLGVLFGGVRAFVGLALLDAGLRGAALGGLGPFRGCARVFVSGGGMLLGRGGGEAFLVELSLQFDDPGTGRLHCSDAWSTCFSVHVGRCA